MELTNRAQNVLGSVLALLGGSLLVWNIGCYPYPEEVEAREVPGCGLTVAFDDATAEAGARALERINQATGCDVSEADDGVPVVAVEKAVNEGHESCGLTYIGGVMDGPYLKFREVQLVEVSTAVAGCNSMEATIIHELFHAMAGNTADHADGGVFHAVSGNGEGINAPTLEAVCSHVDCPSFAPESF